MKVIRSSEVTPQPMDEGGAKGATIRWLISRPEGAPNFAMRVVEVAPAGGTPLHEHAWEHEVYMLEGEAQVISESGPTSVSPGDAVLIMPGERHQIRNVGESAARFLCLIPLPPEE